MKRIKITLSVIIIITNLIGQNRVSSTISCVPLTQGYILESISGNGFTNSTENYISNISSSNPATISNYQNISLGLSYQLESYRNPNWLFNIDHSRKQNYLPQSLGFIFPYKQLKFGIGFSQKYNSIIDYGRFEITTINNPDGTGEYYSVTKTDIVFRYSGICAYTINNILISNDNLNIGLQVDYNSLTVEEKIAHNSLDESANSIGYSFGLLYKIPKIHFGIYYERNPEFREKVNYKVSSPSDLEVPDDEYSQYNLVTSAYLDGKIPDKFHIGLLYKINEHMRLTSDITKVFWNQLSNNSNDYFDISGSFINDFTDRLSCSVSFLSTGREFGKETNQYYNTNDKLYSLFLMGGVNYKIQNFDLDFAFVTSTSLSGEWRKQKIGRISIGYHL